jgi:capsular polysaccharide export protein
MHDFMNEVVKSFAGHAPDNAMLVFKHHPMDRGYNHYGRDIKKLAREYGVESRVFYVFDAELPDLFKITDACVTVNSTVGLIALKKNVPTLALGKAMFADAGLSSDRTLDDFWQNYGAVDHQKLASFDRHIISETLVPGSFYGKRKETATMAALKLERMLSV